MFWLLHLGRTHSYPGIAVRFSPNWVEEMEANEEVVLYKAGLIFWVKKKKRLYS